MFTLQDSIKILHVEDERIVQEHISIMLKRKTKNLYLAASGEEGLEIFRTKLPHILITDISLPGISGIEMCREIQKIQPETKIIFTTAFSDMEFFQAAIDLGVKDYILKPIERSKLFRAVDKCMDEFKLIQEKEQMQTALRQSEQKYRELYENAPIAYITLDSDGIITNGNKEAANLFMQSVGSLKGNYIFDFVCREDPNYKNIHRLFDLVHKRGKPQKGEFLFRRESREKIWINLFANPVSQNSSENGNILVTAINITDKHHYQESLLQNEKIHQRITNNTLDIIVQTDSKGQIKYITHSIELILGYPVQSIMEKNIFSLIHPDEMEDIKTEFFQSIHEKKTWRREFRMRHADGNYSWFDCQSSNLYDESKKFSGTIFSLRNINDQKISTQDAQNKHLFLQQLIDTIPAPIFYKDMQGKYQGCNHAFEAYLGREKKDILGKSVYEIAPMEMAELYHQKDMKLYQEKKIQTYTAKVRSANNKQYHYKFTKALFCDIEGEPAGIVGIMLDNTELENAKITLEKNQKLQNKAQKLFALGTWQLDLSTQQEYWSEELYNIFDIDPKAEPEDFLSILSLIETEEQDIPAKLIQDIAARQKEEYYTFKIKSDSVLYKRIVCQIEYIYDKTKPNNLTQIIGIFQNISFLERRKDSLKIKNK